MQECLVKTSQAKQSDILQADVYAPLFMHQGKVESLSMHQIIQSRFHILAHAMKFQHDNNAECQEISLGCYNQKSYCSDH